VQTITIVKSIPRIIKEHGGLSVVYKKHSYHASERLQEYGLTPLEILDGILTTNKDSLELDTYRQRVDNLFYWMNFFIDICRENPDLKRTCDEYMGWIIENYSTVVKMKKDAIGWASRNYDQKTLAKKFEKTITNFHSKLKQLRGIFYQFEKGLYEGLNV